MNGGMSDSFISRSMSGGSRPQLPRRNWLRFVMTKMPKEKTTPRGKARLRAEIVEAMRGLHKIGAVSDVELQKTTMRMLSKDALPRVKPMSPAQIVAMRERTGVSQAVMAAYLNVAVSTVSQWERGERHPAGAALKLLHVVRQNGIEVLR
jgi:putative transcriptional regulator